MDKALFDWPIALQYDAKVHGHEVFFQWSVRLTNKSFERLYSFHKPVKSLYFRSFVSLACVSSETLNLQRVFRPGGGGVVPFIGYIGMCRAKGYGFVWNRVSISTI